MSLLPDLPPVPRTAVRAPEDGVARAIATGRAYRRRALAPLVAAALALVVVGGAQTLRPAGPEPTASGAFPSSYLAYSTPVGGGAGRPAMEVRSSRDGSLVRAVPYETEAGEITELYAYAAGTAVLVRRPDQLLGLRVCGGSVVLVDGRTGAERELLAVPQDRGITAVALSGEAEHLAYSLTDCSSETQVEQDVELRVRDLATGEEQVGRRSARVEALAWSPDATALFVVGGEHGPWGATRAAVVTREDLDGQRTVVRADADCGLRGAAWAPDGLYSVSSCGRYGDDRHRLQRFAPDGSRSSTVPLPDCSLGAGVSADAATGRILAWVNATGDCTPMNRLLVLRDDTLIDLPRPSSDRLWAAAW